MTSKKFSILSLVACHPSLLYLIAGLAVVVVAAGEAEAAGLGCAGALAGGGAPAGRRLLRLVELLIKSFANWLTKA